MQSVNWYLQRLRSMSADEVWWRVRSVVRDQLDRPRFALGLYPSPPLTPNRPELVDVGPQFRLHDWAHCAYDPRPLQTDEQGWMGTLRDRAEKLLNHRISFFSLDDCYVGDPIDWNRDHESGTAAPREYAGSIDYRDYRVTGDAKIVWELNRHHHLVVLARAYHASGNMRYAEAVVAQMRAWCQSCPFGQGMNWRSPLELAIRLINWVWALDLVRGSGLITPAVQRELLPVVYLHMWEITRKYSRGSSANNHRIGEAAGVFIASQYFPALDPEGRWNEESRAILCEEIELQTYLDGANREQAIGYHLFVLQFFLFSGLVARRANVDFPKAFWFKVNKMLEFVGRLSEGGENIPSYGDCDDGYVLDLGNCPEGARGLLAIGAVLFQDPNLKEWAERFQQAAYWLLGPYARSQFDAIPAADSRGLSSHAFSESGYYLLQCGLSGSVDRISVFFDCGELGFRSIAAHGHADALSFTLRAFGQDILVDPGTYDYFRYPEWRTYFRSTRAHNTVSIDNRDQSEMLGLFLWGARASARCLLWQPEPDGGRVSGEHHGYARPDDPIVHRRTLDLNGQARCLTIQDDIITNRRHEVALYFHLSENCAVSTTGPYSCKIITKGGTVVLDVDSRFVIQVLAGCEDPIGGWVSRRYHQKKASTTLIARGICEGQTSMVSKIAIGAPR